MKIAGVVPAAAFRAENGAPRGGGRTQLRQTLCVARPHGYRKHRLQVDLHVQHELIEQSLVVVRADL